MKNILFTASALILMAGSVIAQTGPTHTHQTADGNCIVGQGSLTDAAQAPLSFGVDITCDDLATLDTTSVEAGDGTTITAASPLATIPGGVADQIAADPAAVATINGIINHPADPDIDPTNEYNTANVIEQRCTATGRENRVIVTDGGGALDTAWVPAPPVTARYTVGPDAAQAIADGACFGDRLVVKAVGGDYDTQETELTGSFFGDHRVAGPAYALSEGAHTAHWIRPGEGRHADWDGAWVWADGVSNKRFGGSGSLNWDEDKNGKYQISMNINFTGLASEAFHSFALPFAVQNPQNLNAFVTDYGAGWNVNTGRHIFSTDPITATATTIKAGFHTIEGAANPGNVKALIDNAIRQ